MSKSELGKAGQVVFSAKGLTWPKAWREVISCG